MPVRKFVLEVLTDLFQTFIRFLKGWAKYLFQSFGAVVALVATDYLKTGADLRLYSEYFIAGYAASVVVLRLWFPKSRRSLWYARQFFKFIYWFITIVSAIFVPFFLTFAPFVTIAGLVPKIAIVIILLLSLSFVGIWLYLMDLLKWDEDQMIAGFQRNTTTIDYEHILMSEEFPHTSPPSLTRKERFKKLWKQRKRILREMWVGS